MADIRLRYGWAWLALFALMVPGMALMSSSDPDRVRLGIALLLTPAVVTTLALVLIYLKSKRQASEQEEGDHDVVAQAAGDDEQVP